MQVKPDYELHQEIDAVIIGACYSRGRRGGMFGEYLLGLAEAPRGGSLQPSTFVSFCRYKSCCCRPSDPKATSEHAEEARGMRVVPRGMGTVRNTGSERRVSLLFVPAYGGGMLQDGA